ncbi:MAG: DUF3604 domain-containing protein [bacterium]
MFRGVLAGTLIVLTAAAVVAYGIADGWFGERLGPGVIEGETLPQEAVAAREANYLSTDESTGRQILFGDLHVHTTFSLDAFTLSLPLLQGEGAHPPADACDYARYCSSLDFWSINDHAEGMTPAQWRSTKEIVRQCNAKAGDPENPDMVTFLGWEWTQIGSNPENHYGHKNVIFLDTEEDKTPTRPIAAETQPGSLSAWAVRGLPFRQRLAIALDAPGGDFGTYQDAMRFMSDRRALDKCRKDVPVRDLPEDCRETAGTPSELFAKLDDWGFPSMVIPHGTTWGFYTPPGSTLDKQLEPGMKPERQFLFEIFSGHGNSEEYRSFRAVTFDEDGDPVCPEPSEDYMPSCWRAGEIIQKRCREAGLPHAECERRTKMARQNYAEAGVSGFRTVPGATVEDWLDAGQCKDCFLPAFNYRPGGSGQYALAIRDFDGEGEPRRFRFGFIGSSDNHKARPGTGFKEFDRYGNTEGGGPGKPGMINDPARDRKEPEPESEPFDPLNTNLAAFDLVEAERQASFFMLGGLVAVHSEGRGRRAIWDALKRREVYATSGERILLWFEMESSGGGVVRMGGSARRTDAPRFTVRALGAFEQKPGCPDHAVNGLSAERLKRLCKGECYHPSDTRKRITHIEIVRIRPQIRPDEPVETLIEDPWRRFPCEDDGAGCTVSFEDPEFAEAARDTVYYARAVQEPTPTINAANLRCTYDEAGRCVKVNPCYKDYRTDKAEECRAASAERAWSSPIFVDYGAPEP